MPSVKDLIELIRSAWPVSVGLLLASALLLWADSQKFQYTLDLPRWVFGTAFLLAIVSASAAVISLLEGLISWVRLLRLEAAYRALRDRQIKELRHLPHDERYLLCWAYANGKRIFTGNYLNGTTRNLITLGYLNVPEGTFATHRTTLIIPDHVWDALHDMLRDQRLNDLVGIENPFEW